jgi:tetratricopeptide (TPR) repeat protein
VAGKRAGRAFGELMQWLDGHPLSIRLTLPHLDTTAPQALLAGLRGTAALPGQYPGGAQDLGGRGTSLSACIGYSYAHLGERTRRLLPAVCLFEGVAVTDVLVMFSQVSGVPERFGQASGEDWRAVLEDAARTGLLTGLGEGMYQIHPALPAYLAALWRQKQPARYDADREAATWALAAACAQLASGLVGQIQSGDAGLAYKDIALQQRTLATMLGYSLDHGLWEEAARIGEALEQYWIARGVDEDANNWADRVRLATEDADGAPPPLDTPAGQLWLFFASAQANRQERQQHLDAAERSYLKILGMLQAQSVSPQQQRQVAGTCHQLGVVALHRGQLDGADGWYRVSLAIEENLGNRPGMATCFHELGRIAQRRGQLNEAEGWYRKSLAIEEDLGDWPAKAGTYHELGNNAYLGGRPGEAEDWYRKSLAISEDLGNRAYMASTYHQLGIAAQYQERLGEAEECYRDSLAISEDLGDQPAIALTYHQLGNVAFMRGRLDEAEQWYRKSLAIEENLGDRPGMASSFGQLGLLAEERGQPRQALEWIIGCVALFDKFPHSAAGPGPEHLARLTAQLGTGILEECWQQVTGGPLPPAVRDYVTARPDPGQ